MEAGGLGIGAVALAGLFNNVVDSYEYVRLGKQYAKDFETSQAKLDLSRLQLSRWGEALGLASTIIKDRARQTARARSTAMCTLLLGNEMRARHSDKSN